MTKQQFLDAFESALRSENADASFVSEQLSLLANKIEAHSDEEFQKIATPENISMLASSAMDEYLSRTKHSSTPKASAEKEPSSISDTDNSDFESDEATKKIEKVSAKGTSDPKVEKTDDVVSVDMTPVIPTGKKRANDEAGSFFEKLIKKSEAKTPSIVFVTLLILSLPLLLFLAGLSVGALVLVYFVFAAIIIALVAAIVAVVCSGSISSIIAILYGATQVMQEPRYVGIHELGFALIIIGATIFISVILYNIAVRLIPWILVKASLIFKYIVSRTKRIAVKARKGCEKL